VCGEIGVSGTVRRVNSRAASDERKMHRLLIREIFGDQNLSQNIHAGAPLRCARAAKKADDLLRAESLTASLAIIKPPRAT
jgi:hypothetical protein